MKDITKKAHKKLVSKNFPTIFISWMSSYFSLATWTKIFLDNKR